MSLFIPFDFFYKKSSFGAPQFQPDKQALENAILRLQETRRSFLFLFLELSMLSVLSSFRSLFLFYLPTEALQLQEGSHRGSLCSSFHSLSKCLLSSVSLFFLSLSSSFYLTTATSETDKQALECSTLLPIWIPKRRHFLFLLSSFRQFLFSSLSFSSFYLPKEAPQCRANHRDKH